MNAIEVLTRVENLKKISDDDEKAHIFEDALYSEVLDFIAHECEDLEEAKGVCKAALTTESISFSRWSE